MIEVDLVVAGAGSDGAVEAGAIAALRSLLDIRRIGGSSAGAINAVGEAAGLPDLPALWRKFLTRGDLEDWHYPPFMRPLGVLGRGRGMMAGKKIREALTNSLGKMRMGDLARPCRITVCNLTTRQVNIIDSKVEAHKDIFCVDALCCTSAVPFVIDAQQLRPLQRGLFSDGGAGANVPVGLWDDEPTRPTVVLRFLSTKEPRPTETLKDFALALFEIRQDAANRALPSAKSVIHYVDLPASRAPLDFTLDAAEVNRRIASGDRAARAWARLAIPAGRQ